MVPDTVGRRSATHPEAEVSKHTADADPGTFCAVQSAPPSVVATNVWSAVTPNPFEASMKSTWVNGDVGSPTLAHCSPPSLVRRRLDCATAHPTVGLTKSTPVTPTFPG